MRRFRLNPSQSDHRPTTHGGDDGVGTIEPLPPQAGQAGTESASENGSDAAVVPVAATWQLAAGSRHDNLTDALARFEPTADERYRRLTGMEPTKSS